jgi:hypothetical protein
MRELRQELAEKVHPTLRLVLRAFKTFREQGERAGLEAACAGFVANILYAIQDFPHRANFTTLPTSSKRSAIFSKEVLKREIVSFCLCGSDRANRETIRLAPQFVENFKTLTDPLQVAEPRLAFSIRMLNKTAMTFAHQICTNGTPQAQAVIGPMGKAIKAVRPNRNPANAFQKLAHWMILVFLFPFGVLKGTESEFSLSAPLSLKEQKEIFDYACPVCPEPHSIQAVRKTAERFKTHILRSWPTASIRGSRSPSGKIRIRIAGLQRGKDQPPPACRERVS